MTRTCLVISHASVLPVNQAVYVRLGKLGWDTTIVVPARWKHVYAADAFAAKAAAGLEQRLRPLPVAFAGRPQRHFYLRSTSAFVRRLRPDIAFIEEEFFSLAAFQWSVSLTRAGVPFGVQADENLDRDLPAVARAIRRSVLERAAFVAVRSPSAAALMRRHGARGEIGLVPHAVPHWEPAPSKRNGVFTVGFAGRLVPEKGIHDLIQAMRRLGAGARLLVVGDGPLRGELEGAGAEVRSGVTHEQMPASFADMDLLVLPSRTTPKWAEQFGRVLVEALSCGVPVVGSDSGAIPWVIQTTGGGLVVPERDPAALSETIARLRADEPARRAFAAAGQAAVERLYGEQAAASALDRLLESALQRKNGDD